MSLYSSSTRHPPFTLPVLLPEDFLKVGVEQQQRNGQRDENLPKKNDVAIGETHAAVNREVRGVEKSSSRGGHKIEGSGRSTRKTTKRVYGASERWRQEPLDRAREASNVRYVGRENSTRQKMQDGTSLMSQAEGHQAIPTPKRVLTGEHAFHSCEKFWGVLLPRCSKPIGLCAQPLPMPTWLTVS